MVTVCKIKKKKNILELEIVRRKKSKDQSDIFGQGNV